MAHDSIIETYGMGLKWVSCTCRVAFSGKKWKTKFNSNMRKIFEDSYPDQLLMTRHKWDTRDLKLKWLTIKDCRAAVIIKLYLKYQTANCCCGTKLLFETHNSFHHQHLKRSEQRCVFRVFQLSKLCEHITVAATTAFWLLLDSIRWGDWEGG